MIDQYDNLREDRDLKQENTAKYLACSQSAYSKIETGRLSVFGSNQSFFNNIYR